MKNTIKLVTKLVALLLVAVMCLGIFASCGKKEDTTPLVVGYAPFNEKFSPFFSETAYDQDVYAMTQLGLLTSDRTGAVVEKGINGTTIAYNGTDYTYYGPADLTITENADGTVDYDFTLRKDIVFSDGQKLTIDDVIFTMYVLSDPAYDGSSTFFALPIEGMKEYRAGMSAKWNLILDDLAAESTANKDKGYYTDADKTAFLTAWNKAGVSFAQSIVDYCMANYASYGAVDVATSAELWGFEVEDGGTAEDFWNALFEAYGYNTNDTNGLNFEKAESAFTAYLSGNLDDEMLKAVQTGTSAPNISGIKKTGDYSMTIKMTKVDATAIYQLGVSITPMHYYGDKSLYNYNANQFGFTKGDLSGVRSKTTKPLGAGPYKFLKYEDGVVYFEANSKYYRGTPKTKYINFKQCMTDDDKLNGVLQGTIDITDPSFSNDTIKAIEEANGGSLDGSVVTTNTVDNLGYGYIGMCATVMNVGGNPSSDASKNLRKAFATVLSVYRELAIDSYYGDRASVINYPISNTSWAAPQSTDDGYKVAFSVDASGKDIYTSGMTADEKYAAALAASLTFFEAAGYTVEDGIVTAAPEGAKLEYEAWIPADGSGDHPSFMILTEASKAFATIGITLKIKDLTNSSELWDALEANQVAMWCAAWGASVDPDMYQIYFSGDGTNEEGGSNYMYKIDDAQLNQLILDARASTDQAYRKSMYKACLDIVVDWAVEIPVYQRQNAIIFSTERVDLNTITPDITTFYGWMSEIENTQLK